MSFAFAGFVKVACVWMVILLPGLDAGHAVKKHGAAAAAPCRLKELAALTRDLVEHSLTAFVSVSQPCFSVMQLSLTTEFSNQMLALKMEILPIKSI